MKEKTRTGFFEFLGENNYLFKPKYPYSFKIDFILDKKNLGRLEFIVKEAMDIAEIKGDKEAINELDKIAEENKGKKRKAGLPLCDFPPYSYPLKTIDEALDLLFYTPNFKKNGDFEEAMNFVRNMFNPIDTEKLYKETGMLITY